MIWLASFPRSGNTFFRNVLFEVYGVSSSAYHQDDQRDLDPDYATYPVVKTHLQPAKLPPEQQQWPAVYLIRDGRDALVSIAHHKRNLIVPGSNFYLNLVQAIIAPAGSHFGGWSKNVDAWVAKASLVIRFSTLIQHPLAELERLRSIMDLPAAQPHKLPSFEQLKFGQPEYGATANVSEKNQKHFRQGRVGGWRADMPDELHQLFWLYHGETMRVHGFTDREPVNLDNPGARHSIFATISAQLTQLRPNLSATEQAEATAMLVLIRRKLEGSEEISAGTTLGYEAQLLRFKATIQRYLPAFIYRTLAGAYRKLPIRSLLQYVRNLIARRSFF